MKKGIFITIVICLIFSSCTSKEYDDSITCEYIANELEEKLSASLEYAAYSEDDIRLLFDETANFSDCALVYSVSSDDIGEIGVFKAENEKDAEVLLGNVKKYLESLKSEKKWFVENYLPDELDKINGADVKRFGKYVILVFVENDKKDILFGEAEDLLKKHQ